MSFQGDVAGLGLGELLQGLGRGGRDGVLTLYGDALSASIGVKGGQLFLLSGPDEDEDVWRERAQRAWAEAPHPTLETSRRQAIARAARMETLYRMLDASNLHFRFEPGPLPAPPGHGGGHGSSNPRSLTLHEERSHAREEPPWGPGMTIEYVLLEHARISDEASSGPARFLSEFDVPRCLDASRHAPEVRDFLAQCDGSSTLLEIADRVGWPLLQVRASLGEHLASGTLRIAQPRELLAAAQRELELGRIGRAATRLTGWVIASPPGPPSVGDADLLVGEWEKGRLEHILHALRPRTARALLRKLDLVHVDAHASRDRWRKVFEAHRADEVSLLHEVALRLVATEEPDARTFHDLLKLARSFQERGFERRTRTLLRLAASHLPSRPQTRIELGRRMLETGLVEDGTRWLLDTARELLDQGDGERAIVPVRAVLKAVPENNEANGLLLETRAFLAKQKRRRWNTLAGLSAGLLLSLVALVKFRSYRDVERQITEINALVSEPGEALALLHERFPEDPNERVAELRSRIVRLKRDQDKKLLDAWTERYQAIEEECRFGDPLRGLRHTLELDPPPDATHYEGTFTERQDLFGILSARLGEQSDALDLPVDATIDELNQEARLMTLLEQLLVMIDPNTAPDDGSSFRFRVAELHEDIVLRREQRAIEREKLMAREKLREQDILLATARAHDQAGDLERSLSSYERLIEMDPELASIPKLREEIERVRAHYRAVSKAVELAERGEHEAAARALVGVCPRPVEHLLPMRIDSRPSGARVTLPDESVRRTPFVAYSGVGEKVTLQLQASDCQPRTVEFDRPGDRVIHLHQFPERTWPNERRVEALPVAVGDDHVVADRYGRLRRLDAHSGAKWERRLETLGGIARTPVFLPGKPGWLLLLSEDGKAWLVHAADGQAIGPRDVGAPPVEGPTLTRGGVSASFADGRVAVWTQGLEPAFYDAEALVQPRNASDDDDHRNATMHVLRRGANRAAVLTSPWTKWTAEVLPEEFRAVGPDGRGFTVERRGEWAFVAWEAPKSLIPHGRLWVSDAHGLRSFLPDPDRVVSYR